MGSTKNRTAPQTLLIDADDTLWENNIYFERAIASFISFVDHAEHTAKEVRERLNQVERQVIAERGYGTDSFRISLVRCFETLSQAPPTAEQHARIMSFVDAIVHAKIEVMAGVRESLETLGQTHRLVLMTKGNELEQREKLERSRLAPLFFAVEVVEEKTAASYLKVVDRHGCDPASTWMIGNSPKSDINPALEAGLHAVFIPHSDTWVLEHEVLSEAPPGQRLLTLKTLSELEEHLSPSPPSA